MAAAQDLSTERWAQLPLSADPVPESTSWYDLIYIDLHLYRGLCDLCRDMSIELETADCSIVF